jgi:transposase
VDVSSEKLDARIGHDGPSMSVECSEEGVSALGAFCKNHGVELVVMEATGGYEKLPFALLWGQGLPCAIVNPRSVRNFAKGMGFLEKTDRIDAGIIAWFGEAKRLVAQEPASDAQKRLRALVTRLRQLTELRTGQTNQRRLLSEAEVQASIDELVAFINRQIRSCEKAIVALLDSDPSRASPAAPSPASWPSSLRSAPSPTKPLPSWLAWRPSPTIAANARAKGQCAADEPTSGRSSSPSPRSFADMCPSSPLSTAG